jgi:1-acyl-sn-glycerol-3-phosphate acyltransferase
MKAQKPVHAHSFMYAMLKPVVKFFFRIFAGKLEIRGLDKLPKDGSLIFAPNHQNALLDALAVAYIADGQPVFVARADMFKNKLAARILRFFKIVPAYRIRDGFSSLSRNNESFNEAKEALLAGASFGIMPEGTHIDRHVLGNLSKGIFRIAIDVQLAAGDAKNIYVVPLGIHYTDYNRFGTGLFLQVGDAINMTEYTKAYNENAQATLGELREMLYKRIDKVMLNVKPDSFYESIYTISCMLSGHLEKPSERFDQQKATANVLAASAEIRPQYFESLHNAVVQRNSLFKEKGLDPYLGSQLQTSKSLFIKLYSIFLGLPIFIYGFINHLLLLIFIRFALSKNEDTQFVSTIKLAGGIVFGPMFYVLQSFVVAWITGSALYALIYGLTLFPMGWLAAQWFVSWREVSGQLKRHRVFKKEPKMAELESELLNTVGLFLRK